MVRNQPVRRRRMKCHIVPEHFRGDCSSNNKKLAAKGRYAEKKSKQIEAFSRKMKRIRKADISGSKKRKARRAASAKLLGNYVERNNEKTLIRKLAKMKASVGKLTEAGKRKEHRLKMLGLAARVNRIRGIAAKKNK